MKIVYIIGLVAAGLVCFCIFCCETEKPAAVKEAQWVRERFFNDLKEMSSDPNQKQNYLSIIDMLARIVSEEAKKDPQAMSSHIEEMIRLIPRARPGAGAAIEVEEYASDKVREEMNKLRQEGSVENLVARDNLISAQEKLISVQNELISRINNVVSKADEVISSQEKVITHGENIKSLQNQIIEILKSQKEN